MLEIKKMFHLGNDEIVLYPDSNGGFTNVWTKKTQNKTKKNFILL